MQRVTLGKWGSEAASWSIKSDSESIFWQQFCEDHGNNCCYSIHSVSSTIVWFARLLQQVSNDDTWACGCIIL